MTRVEKRIKRYEKHMNDVIKKLGFSSPLTIRFCEVVESDVTTDADVMELYNKIMFTM